MPRKAREKNTYAVYHITCRSISEIMLFIDNEDKEYYLKLLKKYMQKNNCSLYAYCLMNNHIHLHLDTRGFDISIFMHSLNTSYVIYFNKKHNRHGHLFQGRFGSKILYNDAYNLAVSAYIHNNPKDIPDYSGREEYYEYSSYGIYLGTMPDRYNIIDKSFIKGLFNACEHNSFAKRYHEFVRYRYKASEISSVADIIDILPETAECEYVSGRMVIVREKDAAKIIAYISEKFNVFQHTSLGLKARHKLIEYRAFVAYALRVLCNLSYRTICKYLSNITISSCSRLCSQGYDLVSEHDLHMKTFNELIANTM